GAWEPPPLTATVTGDGNASTSLPCRKLNICDNRRRREESLTGCRAGWFARFLCIRVRQGGVRFSRLATVLFPYFAHCPDRHHQQGNHPDQDDPEKYSIKHSSNRGRDPLPLVSDFNLGGTACCRPTGQGRRHGVPPTRQILFGMLKV